MAVLAQIALPAAEFALRDALKAAPAMYVEADRIAAHSPGATMPCLWVTGGDFDAFEAALEDDPTVDEIRATARGEGERLYHVEWADDVARFVRDTVDHEGVILEANGHRDRWRLTIRFMTQEQLDDFQAFMNDRGVSFTLERLFETSRARPTRGSVTDEQYEALVAAVEAGYFAVPRETTTEELADELGISHQSVSERLRRGTANLVRGALTVEIDRNLDG